MEILRSNSGGRAWSSHGTPISSSSKCQGKWRSMAVPGTGPPKAIRMASAEPRPSKNGNNNGNEKEKEVSVLEMISSGAESKPWWTPLFSFSSPPPSSPSNDGKAAAAAKKSKSGVVFTEEKARLLRRQLRATEGWENHGMYHSAVASRLALRPPDRKPS